MPDIGMFSWFSYDLPIEERLRLIKDAGFDATSLWWKGEDKHLQPDLARRMGLQIDNIHAPFDNPNDLWVDVPGGEDYLRMLIECVNDCRLHDIPVVVVHASRFTMPVETSPLGLDRIRKLADAAEKNGVKVAFENLSDIRHLDLIFENIKSDAVGFCYDSGHENCNHPDADCLTRYGERLFALHLDDNFGDSDTHLLPFDGNINWVGVKKGLSKCREVDYITLEVDFDRSVEKSRIYTALSAGEYVKLAYEKALKICNL